MLRAGPFSDERVIRLANRRFVPFYFDLSDQGFAGDPDARRFVVAARPELGGNAVPTPPVLFMTPEGSVVGDVSNYATADQLLAAMLKVLRDHSEYNRPTDEEKKLQDPIRRAEVLIDLQQLAEARRLLEPLDTVRAHYLLGRLARWRGDWQAMERHFQKVEKAAAADAEAAGLLDDVRMERAYRYWSAARFQKLYEHLHGFPRKSNRYTEARYYEGLALYHLGRHQDARDIWAATIKACAQDPWIYRADWAYVSSLQRRRPGPLVISSRGPRSSLLNRIGYMGRGGNPDLTSPPQAGKPTPPGDRDRNEKATPAADAAPPKARLQQSRSAAPAPLLGAWKSEDGQSLLRFEPQRCFVFEQGRLRVFRARYQAGQVELHSWLWNHGRSILWKLQQDAGHLERRADGKTTRYVKLDAVPSQLDISPLPLGTQREVPQERRQQVQQELKRRAPRRGPKADADNTAYVKKLVAKYGWIDVERFGQKASNAAFLIVQHSGDVRLMQAVLPEIEKDLKARRLRDAQPFALLYDRTQMFLGNKQRYGTQIGTNERGERVVLPLEDRQRVDEFRRQIGLFPLKQYLDVFSTLAAGGKPVKFADDQPADTSAQKGAAPAEPGHAAAKASPGTKPNRALNDGQLA